MKMPWHDQTGTARLVAILATVFGVAVGLCGLNTVAFFTIQAPGATALVVTGYIELAALLLSAAGLLLAGIYEIYRTLIDARRKQGGE